MEQLIELTQSEIKTINGGMSPQEVIKEIGDWVADKIGWLIGMEGARVAGSTKNGGNAAAVIAFK